MCGFIGEVNLETPQQSKVFDANLKLKNRGPDSQKIGYINENLEFKDELNISINDLSKSFKTWLKNYMEN